MARRGKHRAPRRRLAVSRSVLEPLPDLVDIVLGHELGSRVEIGGGYVAIKLQVELHDRIEPLQERLLAERALESAGLDLLELLRSKVEAVGADLIVEF